MRCKRWSDIKLGTKGLIVVAAPAAATVLIACAAHRIGSLTEKAESEVNQAIEVSAMIRELRADEISASAAMRGFLISGDERLASQIRGSLAAFQTTGEQLAELIADDQTQRDRLDVIEALQRRRTEAIFVDLARFRAGMLSRESQREGLFTAERERGEMEELIATMLARETRMFEERTARAQALRSRLSAVIGICAIGGVLGGCIISMLFASGITSRIEKLKQNVSRLATGARLDAHPAGSDEIGLLNEGVIRTAEILRTKATALENALQGIAQADARGRLVSYNKACAELLGLEEAPSTVEILSTVCAEDRARFEQAIRSMRESGRCEIEGRIRRADGSMTDVQILLLPLSKTDPDGGYHVFFRDITPQRKAEEALIRARDAALVSSRMKTEFLAKISHDIRTPLNAILGSADLLSQTSLDANQSEYVGMFQRNCRRLVALINDFLDFSRIEAGAVCVVRTAFRLRQTVDDVICTFREAASRKGIALSVDIAPGIPDSLMGDPHRIQQVLTNLVSNALKFTHEGQVDVRVCTGTVGAAEFLQFEIADTGLGIAPADHDRIFAAFAQLPDQPASSHARGSGLGLTICRELVQLMGGDIGVESRLGAGSRFHFTLPFERADPGSSSAASQATQRSPERGTLRPMRILIAEDAEDNRALVRHYLHGQPLDIRFVDDGQQAVDAVTGGEDFDLILMDLDMPVMDGHSAVRKIRQWEAFSERSPVPIVALSAHAIVEEVRSCLDEGCVAHVAKPVDQPTLIETVGRYARERSGELPLKLSNEVKALVPSYLRSKSRQIQEAFVHLNGRDFEAIRRFGHNLKGTGRGYGFPEIEDAGRRIEKSAQVADEAEIALQLSALSSLVSDAFDANTR
jgi:PAS domain S-box-containing protein